MGALGALSGAVRVFDYLRSLLPAYVLEVAHISTEGSQELECLYTAQQVLFMGWPHAIRRNVYLPPHGHYYIKVWDHGRIHEYFLSADRVAEALGLRALCWWWTLSDVGIVTSLRLYRESLRSSRKDVLALMIANRDVSAKLTPVMKCIALERNATSESIVALAKYKRIIDPWTSSFIKVTRVDYELNEHPW